MSSSPVDFELSEHDLALLYGDLDQPARQEVEEGPGASSPGPSRSSSEKEEGIVQLPPADIQMEIDSPDVEGAGGEVVTPNESAGAPVDWKSLLSPFGENYLAALGKLLSVQARFAVKPTEGKEVVWSPAIRKRKVSHIIKMSEEAFMKLSEAIIVDRKVRIRESSATAHPDSKDFSPQPSTPNFNCPCEQVHKAVASCKIGMGHAYLCEEHLKLRTSSSILLPKGDHKKSKANKAEAQTSSASGSSTLQTQKPQPQPTEAPFVSTASRGRHNEGKGRGGRGGKRDRSTSSSHRGQPSHKHARGRGTNRQSEVRFHEAPSTSTSCTTTQNTIPSSGQFRQLFSQGVSTDIRERPADLQASRARLHNQGRLPSEEKPKPPTPPVLPALIGEWARKPNGEIDWARAPTRPANLHPDAEFHVSVVKNRWHVDLVQPK